MIFLLSLKWLTDKRFTGHTSRKIRTYVFYLFIPRPHERHHRWCTGPRFPIFMRKPAINRASGRYACISASKHPVHHTQRKWRDLPPSAMKEDLCRIPESCNDSTEIGRIAARAINASQLKDVQGSSIFGRACSAGNHTVAASTELIKPPFYDHFASIFLIGLRRINTVPKPDFRLLSFQKTTTGLWKRSLLSLSVSKIADIRLAN